MRGNNEGVYAVPGHNYFGCIICGRDKCNVAIPVSLNLFHKLCLGDEVEVIGRGYQCGRSQYVYLRRPMPPPMLNPSEISVIVQRLAERWG